MHETSPTQEMRPVIPIPVYRPGEHMPGLVEELAGRAEIGAVIVVEDASQAEYREIFRRLAT
jgi:hypothetical protein